MAITYGQTFTAENLLCSSKYPLVYRPANWMTQWIAQRVNLQLQSDLDNVQRRDNETRHQSRRRTSDDNLGARTLIFEMLHHPRAIGTLELARALSFLA
jgi:hypothetical protein